MLLVPAVTFAPVDERSFDVAITDRGNTVKGRVFTDDRGAPVDFETTDRFCEDPADRKRFVRARWSTPVAGFQDIDGRKIALGGRAVWHLPQGDNLYADFEVVPGSVAFNVRAGE